MRITRIRTFALKLDKDDFFGGKGHVRSDASSPYLVQPGWRGIYSSRIETMIVRIETSEGIVGYGEGQSPIAPEVSAAIVNKVLAAVLIGRDPLAPRALRREMYDLMNLRGHTGGFMVDAISAIDIALWDVAGKAAGLPIYRLFGGPCRDVIPVYVSGVRGESVSDKIAMINSFIDRGFTDFKLFAGFGVAEDAELVRALLEGVGYRARLAVDVLWKYDTNSALRLGRLLETAGALWLEAPVEPEDVAGNSSLARALDLPIANGETLRTRLEFRPWLEQRAIDIAQPDIGRCGLTEGLAVIELAETFHVPVALHMGMASAVMIAATLQAAAASPHVGLIEYQPVVLEAANQLLTTPLRCEAGRMKVPAGPGLGIELNDAALEHFAI
jgi:galactonate dehydratase